MQLVMLRISHLTFTDINCVQDCTAPASPQHTVPRPFPVLGVSRQTVKAALCGVHYEQLSRRTLDLIIVTAHETSANHAFQRI
jgi:hypothetical protein